jgi:hypothetical protein
LQFLVRLADRQGLLHGFLNKVQKWALAWLMTQENKDKIQEEDSRQQYLLWVTDFPRWQQLYQKNDEEDSPPIEISELSKIDDYLKTLSEPRTASTALTSPVITRRRT